MPIAHLAHAELEVADLEASRDFFTRILGLSVSDEDDQHVYLRAWQDWDHHTLLLTQAETSALGHVAWRVSGPEDLREFEAELRRARIATEWLAGGTELGQGDSLRFTTPAGLPFELFWETERYVEHDPAMQSLLPSHPQRYTGGGAHPRRFDHVNFLVDDPAREQRFLSDELGIRHNYYMVGKEQERLASWLSKTNLSHEIAVMRNGAQSGPLLHHVGYYLDSADQVIRAATILADAGVQIEWGPGTHGTSGAIFLYCFEPSGHRVEVWTGGFLLFSPDWEAIRWDPEVSSLGLEMWGSMMPESFLRAGTPISAGSAAAQHA